MAVYLFCGQEEYNMETEIKALREKLLDEKFSAMNYRVYDNPGVNTFLGAIQAQPLMFGNVLTVINSEKYLFTNRKSNTDDADGAQDDNEEGASSFNDKQLACLEEALQTMAGSLHIVLVAKSPRDKEKKVDTRKKLYKLIAKYATVKEFPQLKAYDSSLPSWIINKAKQQELVMTNDTAAYLIEYSGTNLRKLDNYIEKIKIAIYPEKTITKQIIKDNCEASEDIFVLVDLIASGQKDLALLEFDRLCTNSHPLAVLASLQTNLKTLMNIKLLQQEGASAFDIAQKVRRPEFIVKKQLQKLNPVSFKRLVQIKLNLTEAEFNIKTGKLENISPIELAILN